ncbi:hypothetical protein [Streptomyces flaveus]|uniref:Right handed beta helix domain-containing protein n=1 Tax=Streptomyces flaveus TaxID=66370 RepID=A0A917VH09_9ACTN|nr:hypothetical protein [Streptomyces flaveus]GGK80273.1 hypothetical protein GCM10010094_47030 [Streptomyces flaveus]
MPLPQDDCAPSRAAPGWNSVHRGGGIYLRGEQGSSFADGAVISGNAATDSKHGDWNVGIYTDDSTNWVTVDRNTVYDYVASIGACNEEWGNRPVQNVR